MKKLKSILSVLTVVASSLFIGAALTQMTGSTGLGVSVAFIGIVFGIGAGLANRKQRMIVALSCSSLIADFEADCTTLPVGGLEVDLWLINRDEINLTSTTIGTVDSARIISALAMTSGTYAYKFTGIKTSNASSITMNAGKYSNNWIHSLSLVVFDNTSATKVNIIETLAGANLVAVVRNKWKGTSSNMEFEVLGWDVGLEGSAIEKKSDDADTQNAWKVTLTSPKDQFENNAGYLLWNTDQTTTLAIIENLESN